VPCTNDQALDPHAGVRAMSAIVPESEVRTHRAHRSRKPVARTLRILADPFAGGLIRMTIGGEATLYKTQEVPVDPEFGAMGFQYQKVTDDHTPVGDPFYLLASSCDPAAAITCDCLGFTRWAHCKHVDALRVLMTRRSK